MVHAAEGTLQAYLDGEIGGAAAAALRDHVAACAACAGELAALRRANERVSVALALADTPVESAMLRAQVRLAAERRGGGRAAVARLSLWSLAKAAMLLLVVAGAAAAAIPEVRRALGTTLERVAELFTAEERTAVESPEAPAGEAVVPESGMTVVAPADGSIRVGLAMPTGAVEVVVRLIDEPRARVETMMTEGTVHRRAGSGRLDLLDLGAGVVTIGIPREVPSAAVEVDGRVVVYKQGDVLRGTGPAGTGRGSELRFMIGS